MRLLYVLPEFPPDFGGGIATVYGQLLPRLAAAGHRITVLLASRERLDQPGYLWQGVEVVPLQSAALAQGQQQMHAWRHHAFLNQFLPVAWAAWSQAQELGAFEVVEATDWALLFLPWLVQRRSQPVVVSLHGSCGQVDWEGNPAGRSGEGQLVRLLETAVMPLADRLIANSTLNADFWWQHCGVRPQVIPPIAAQPTAAAAGIARSPRGLVVARIQNWKGPEVLCRALRDLPGQQIDWIGHDTPWQESTITTSTHLRKEFPDVVDHQLHLLGPLPPEEVLAHIQQAAYLCVPSLWDVFNVTLIEAIAVGTPVICSRRAGASMIIHHGQSGYLADPDQPYDLADSIRSLQALSSEERQVVTAAALSSLTRFLNPARIVALHEAAYHEALDAFRSREPSPWLSDLMAFGACSNIGAEIRVDRLSARAVMARAFRWAQGQVRERLQR